MNYKALLAIVLKYSKTRWFRKILAVGLTMFIGWFFGLMIAFYYDLPPLSELENYRPSLASKIYDQNGELIAQLFVEQRTLVPLSRIPEKLKKTILVIEDDGFYSHLGISPLSILRAFLVNLSHGRVEQGGSTITQQLAKNLFLTQDRTFSRKIREVMLSFKIEYRYTKDEILEMYLNQINMGSGAYGVETAARTYFGKHVEELSLPECALLAGLPRAPNKYSPYNNPKKAKQRRDRIIDRLIKKRLITKLEADTAKHTPIRVHRIEQKNAPYFVEYVRQQLEETYGANVIYKGGLSVYTSLDMKMQDMAQKAVAATLAEAEKKIALENGIPVESIHEAEFRKNMPVQASFIALDPKTGYIKALVGGRDFSESQFNRATQSKRQPGSAFKPFIYTTAIDNGFTPADIIVDAPMPLSDGNEGQVWKPENYEKKFFGPTTLRKALTLSRNVVTLKLLMKVGASSVASYAHKMGIKSQIHKNLSLAFGTSEVTLMELVSAYSTFPNFGVKVDPISILMVKDSMGKVLEENRPHVQDVLRPEAAYILTSMMESVVNEGTAARIRADGIAFNCAGKTGTTDNQSDVWFAGFTSDLAAGGWVGFDDRRSLGKWISSANTPVPMWTAFMKEVYKEKPPEPFSRPPNIVTVRIDPDTGLLWTNKCKRWLDEVFISGTEPTEKCNKHDKF
ncbi:MAG: PBP1A family penicillin-binding protein [Candidatus Firestonebacteria bacterium]